MRKVTKGLVPVMALALVAAACGGSDSGGSSAPATDAAPAGDMTETTMAGDMTETTMAADMTETTMAGDMASETTAAGDMTETTTAQTAPAPAADIATDYGITDDTIRVGMSADLSGIFAPLVTQIVDAQQVFWDKVNAAGGIAGRQIELEILDNGYDVPTQLENYDQLSDTGDKGVAVISQSTGSPHTAAIAEALTKDNLLAIPLSWYSGWADPVLGANVMELYTSYCVEAMNGVTWLAGENNAKTIAIISFPGEYGQDGATGAKMAAEALGLEVVYDGEGAVVPGSDQGPVVTELVAANPDIVWASINPTTLAEILGSAYAQGLRAQWSGNSPTWNYQLLATELATAADEVYTHSTYTQLWESDTSPGMTDLVDSMRAKRPDAALSDAYIIGWTEGYAIQQLLEQAAADGDMTRAGIVAALQNVNVDFGGLAPDQTWSGEPNDYIVRESYMYDVDLASFTAGATVSDEGAGTGFILQEGPFVSDTAASFVYDGPCFVAG